MLPNQGAISVKVHLMVFLANVLTHSVATILVEPAHHLFLAVICKKMQLVCLIIKDRLLERLWRLGGPNKTLTLCQHISIEF